MVTLVIISIAIFLIIGPWTQGVVARLISRILLVPVIAGVSYEYIRWNARNMNHPIIKVLYRPNLAVQNVTTADPDDDMLEVAIQSFRTMLAFENGETPENVLELDSLKFDKAVKPA